MYGAMAIVMWPKNKDIEVRFNENSEIRSFVTRDDSYRTVNARVGSILSWSAPLSVRRHAYN